MEPAPNPWIEGARNGPSRDAADKDITGELVGRESF